MTDIPTDTFFGSGNADQIRNMLMILGLIILACVCIFFIGKWLISIWAWKSEGYVTKKKLKKYKESRWHFKLRRKIAKKKTTKTRR